MDIVRKNSLNDPKLISKNNVSFLTFDELSRLDWLTHCFTTRLGGVSEGCYSTMNLGFLKSDPAENVRENYKRLGGAVGFDWTKAVLSWQTHTTNVMRVFASDAGKGTVRERDYKDIDGFITNETGIPLVTFYADCVPLYFADTKNHAIGLSHSGWRGTVKHMGKKTLDAMHEAFGTDPKDVVAAIGPSICGDCFEVGPEVAEEFSLHFTPAQMTDICKDGIGDRKLIDLWKANKYVLMNAGLCESQISVTNICTRCNPELLYSHRIMGPRRGNLAAVMMINTPNAF